METALINGVTLTEAQLQEGLKQIAAKREAKAIIVHGDVIGHNNRDMPHYAYLTMDPTKVEVALKLACQNDGMVCFSLHDHELGYLSKTLGRGLVKLSRLAVPPPRS